MAATFSQIDVDGRPRRTSIAKRVVQSRCNGAAQFAVWLHAYDLHRMAPPVDPSPAHVGRKPQMGTTPTTAGESIADHETARRSFEVAVTARRLQLGGFTLTEASNLTARMAGLPPVRTGWSVRQVEHLLFLRSIVETGRLEP
jgi:hypothetical protein